MFGSKFTEWAKLLGVPVWVLFVVGGIAIVALLKLFVL